MPNILETFTILPLKKTIIIRFFSSTAFLFFKFFPTFLFDQMRRASFGQENRRSQVGVHHLIETLRLDGENAIGRENTSIIH